MHTAITRWDKWYADDNLRRDERILAAPPSRCAEKAARAFLSGGKRRILDLACGVGRDTRYLASRGLAVVGVDASPNGLRVARQTWPGRDPGSGLVVADARCLPFGDGSFDGVYCFGLLHEFTAEGWQEDVERVMGEIRRLLCHEGILVLAVLSGDPEAGLPAVQLYSRQMFERVTQGLQPIEIEAYDDVGCTGRTDYHIWYGMYVKYRTCAVQLQRCQALADGDHIALSISSECRLDP
jgi:SAM-dependent methyltransferase